MAIVLFGLPIALPANQSGSLPAEKVLRIYLDSDRTRHLASARSMEMGIKTAFSEVSNNIQGFTVEFVTLDHRGNSSLSKRHMMQAMADPQMLFVLAGLHSPPLIKHREFINENQILTLVPWAAGGPITRSPHPENWIFRLSVDDHKAGVRIARTAMSEKNCQQPHLFLEQTEWGESNRKTMSNALELFTGTEPNVYWFNWGIRQEQARIALRNLSRQGVDCVLFVGNAADGVNVFEAMASLEPNERIPMFSHWGITGGSFYQSLAPQTKANLDVLFVQSCFSFISAGTTDFAKRVFGRASHLFPELKTPYDLDAPTGFVHAYDLGQLVIHALGRIDLTQNMVANRNQLRQTLENLPEPVDGLIKTYNAPFSHPTEGGMDAHEALGLKDLCMGYFGPEGEIRLHAEKQAS